MLHVERMKKSKWKKIIRDKIRRSAEEAFKQEVEIKTKLRFLRDKTVEKKECIKFVRLELATNLDFNHQCCNFRYTSIYK